MNTSVVGGPFSFVVTNTSNSGAGSLRQAILNANASAGPDAISFAIPGAGAHTIAPTTALPEITDQVVIDATSQPGFTGAPVIELSGVNVSAGPRNGLLVSSGNSTIRGLVINRWDVGISTHSAGGNVIQGNFIGTDVTGTVARPNANGIQIGNTITSSPNNVIGGTTATARNVISGNSQYGVVLEWEWQQCLGATTSELQPRHCPSRQPERRRHLLGK